MQPYLIESRTTQAVNRWLWKASKAILFGHEEECECDQCQLVIRGAHSSIFRMNIDHLDVGTARDFRRRCSVTDWEAGKHIIYMGLISSVAVGAGDVLLKILEEPPEGLQILIGVTGRWLFPNTILSRCQVKTLPHKKEDQKFKELVSMVDMKSGRREDKEEALEGIAVASFGEVSLKMLSVMRRKRRNLDLIMAEHIMGK